MSDHDRFLHWLLGVANAYYSVNPRRTCDDTARVVQTIPSLSVKTDVYTWDDGQSELLLVLIGTVPATFRGNVYDFPVSVWIPRRYPNVPPIGYVTPTPNMMVKPGQHVDSNGKIYHPYLAEWTAEGTGSSLAGFVDVLKQVFSKAPPAVARPRSQQQQQQQQQQQRLGGGGAPSSARNSPVPPPLPPHPLRSQSTATPAPTIPTPAPNSQPEAPPPRPPKPGDLSPPVDPTGPSQGPGHRLLSEVMPTSSPTPPPRPPKQQTQIPSHSSAPPRPGSTVSSAPPPLPPPVPPHPPQRPPSYHSTGSPFGMPPPPTLPAQGVPHAPQQFRPQYHAPFPNSQQYHPPPPQLPRYTPSPNVTGPAPGPSPYPHPPPSFPSTHLPPTQLPPQAQPPQLKPEAQPAIDLLSLDLDDSTSDRAPSAVTNAPPVPPNPEKDRLLSEISSRLLSEAHQSLQSSHSTLITLDAYQSALLSTKAVLESELSQLSLLSAHALTNASTLRTAITAAQSSVQEISSTPLPDIDTMLVGTSVPDSQLYDVCADETSAAEARLALGRALDAGRISVPVFVKQSRALGRDEFLKKALARKIAKGLGMHVVAAVGGGGDADAARAASASIATATDAGGNLLSNNDVGARSGTPVEPAQPDIGPRQFAATSSGYGYGHNRSRSASPHVFPGQVAAYPDHGSKRSGLGSNPITAAAVDGVGSGEPFITDDDQNDIEAFYKTGV